MSRFPDRRGIRPAGARLGRFPSPSLAGLLLLAVFAIGAVHGSISAVLEMALWTAGFLWFVTQRRSQQAPGAFIWTAVALSLYLGLGPVAWRHAEFLSPATEGLEARALSVLEETSRSVRAVEPPAAADEALLPAPARERVLALAVAGEAPSAQNRQPLALNPFAARSDLLRYLAYGLALWLAATLPQPASLVRSLVQIGAAVATVALVQAVTWNGKILWFYVPFDGVTHYPRMTGPYVNADHFAALLEMLLPLGVALLAVTWSARPKGRGARGDRAQGILPTTMIGMGLVMMIAALIGTASRAGMTAAILGMLVFWTGAARAVSGEAANVEAGRRRENRAQRAERIFRRYAPYLLVAAIAVLGITNAGAVARSLFSTRFEKALSGAELSFRGEFWNQSLQIVRDFPLFGVGLGGWREIILRYEHYPLVGHYPNHAHNDYLEWLTEVGLVGVVLTAALAWAYVRWARGNDRIPRTIRWGLIGGVSAIAVHETIDFSLRVPANALVLSVLLGLLCNRSWGESGWRERSRVAEVEAEEPLGSRRRRLFATAGATVLAAVLCFASVRQFRESLLWGRVHGGSTDLAFAPDDASTWEELGLLLERSGLRGDPVTEACFRAAILRRPTSANSFWRIAVGRKDAESKRAAMEAALYFDPTNAQWRLSYAALLDSLGRHREAIVQLEEAVYRDPRISQHEYLDPKDGRLNEVFLEAVERGFRRALGDRPDDPVLLNEVATFYRRFGIWGEAAALSARAAELSYDESSSYFHRLRAADSYAHVENYERAEELVRKAISDAPGRVDGYRLLATGVLRPQKRYEEARQILNRGIQRTRNPAPLYLALFDLERGQGDSKAAVEALRRAADLERGDANLQSRLGMAYLEGKDYHRAKAAFDRAIHEDPNRAQFHYYRGIALERLYDLGGARESYRRAVELEPANEAFTKAAARVEAAFEEATRQKGPATMGTRE